jgi:CheY-like chemotaxis protein
VIEADASAAAPGDRVRVLFVDDDPGYLRAVRRLLRPGAAVELLVAGDGNTARRIVDADPPDMIVLDVYMPDLDGIEYCRRLKGQDRTEHSVVVVVSAAMTAGLEHAARDAGATRALDKVADLDELFRLIRNHRPTPRAEGRATGGSGSRARLQDPHEVAERLAVKLASAFDPWLDVPRATSAAQRALDLAAATYTPSCGESFPAFTERYVYAELFALVRAAACGDATPATADDPRRRCARGDAAPARLAELRPVHDQPHPAHAPRPRLQPARHRGDAAARARPGAGAVSAGAGAPHGRCGDR